MRAGLGRAWIRWVTLAVISATTAIRVAYGAEPQGISLNDPLVAIVRLMADFGALGAFIIYLIYDKKKDREKSSKNSEHWHSVNNQMIGLVRETALCMTECTAAMREMRLSVDECHKDMTSVKTILATGKPYHRRESDRE